MWLSLGGEGCSPIWEGVVGGTVYCKCDVIHVIQDVVKDVEGDVVCLDGCRREVR